MGRKVTRTEAAYFALSGPKRQKKMTRRMGKLEKTRKEGRLGKDCEEWDTYDSLQGVLHPVGEWLRPLTGPTGSRRSESDHRRSKKQLHTATLFITAQGKELHGKLCSVSSSQNIVCSGHFLANSPH